METSTYDDIWVFPKIVVPPNHPLIGFSIIFTIHFGVPLFLETPIWIYQFLKDDNISRFPVFGWRFLIWDSVVFGGIFSSGSDQPINRSIGGSWHGLLEQNDVDSGQEIRMETFRRLLRRDHQTIENRSALREANGQHILLLGLWK